MPKIDSEKFYTSAIEKFGVTAQGLGWFSKASQEIRFDVILDMLPNKIDSITDAGCGFGDFYLYLEKNSRIPKKYIGIDSLNDMYSIASEATGQEIIIADICTGDIPPAQYYICSGAMNVLNSFETHLFMRSCFMASNKAFIFNILHGDINSDTYNYISTSKIEEIAKDLDVAKVEIRDGYMENDITVGFYK